jgi:hypothetical protein
MDGQAREAARRWLAEDGVLEVGPDQWTDGETPGKRLTTEEVAHEWAGVVFIDDRLDPAGQTRLAFGMLDLLDHYWVTCEIRMAHQGTDSPLPPEVLWDCHRQRLEAPEVSEALTYSLWVDWFEDPRTSATAFGEVLGRDVGRLTTEAADPGLLHRAGHVLECSGPVAWETKEPAYRAAARLPSLHPALFKGLLTSYLDVYGDLRPEPALELLADLELPPHQEHLSELRIVLEAGHTKHRHSPEAWAEALRTTTNHHP